MNKQHNPENTCPHCGGKAYRKALQKLKDQPKPYRRMLCADGCGHYHYRDPESNEVVDVGSGLKIPFYIKQYQTSISIDSGSSEGILAEKLDIDVLSLQFTAKNDSGRPRALVNCLSDADIALLDESDGETVRKLHKTLLTVQACIGVYREHAQVIAKGKK